MREAEHRKQLLIQQITDHRELTRLEIEVLRESNPVKPLFESGRRLFEIVGALRPGRGTRDGSESGHRTQLDIALVRTALPVVLQVMRAVLRRHKEKRAAKKGT